eukprot:5533261-Pleurochrysis_carterae.AAC.2
MTILGPLSGRPRERRARSVCSVGTPGARAPQLGLEARWERDRGADSVRRKGTHGRPGAPRCSRRQKRGPCGERDRCGGRSRWRDGAHGGVRWVWREDLMGADGCGAMVGRHRATTPKRNAVTRRMWNTAGMPRQRCRRQPRSRS